MELSRKNLRGVKMTPPLRVKLALSQVYLSITFQLSQTPVVKVEMSSTSQTIPITLTNSQL